MTMDSDAQKTQDAYADTAIQRKVLPMKILNQPSPQSPRNVRKPPPPTKPRPVIPQKPASLSVKKPANLPIKCDSDERKSLTRQGSGPKPPLPSRPPSLKRSRDVEPQIVPPSTREYNDETRKKRTDEGRGTSLDQSVANFSAQEVEEAPPLLRTMSGPVNPRQSEYQEKLRSVSLLDKENVAPKPLPRPRTTRRGSNEVNKPVPPPRLKKDGKVCAVFQNDINDSIKEEEVTPTVEVKDRTRLTGEDEDELIDKSNFVTGKNNENSGAISIDDTGISCAVVVEAVARTGSEVESSPVAVAEDEKEIISDDDYESIKDYVMPDTFGLVSSESAAASLGETTDSHLAKDYPKNLNPYENVPAFEPPESSSNVDAPETRKKALRHPYENFPSPLKVGNAEIEAMANVAFDFKDEAAAGGCTGIMKATVGSLNSDMGEGNVAGGDAAKERIDYSDFDYDYESIPYEDINAAYSLDHNDQFDHDDQLDHDYNDYQNADVVDRKGSQLGAYGGGMEEFGSPGFERDSSPLDFKKLRIDADDIVCQPAYVSVPRNGPLFNQREDDVSQLSFLSPQVHAAVQEADYQAPLESPKSPACRSLFGNESGEKAQATKRNRRPAPQPPMIDSNLNILRSKTKKSEQKGQPKVSLPSKLLQSDVQDENIYLVPKIESGDASSLNDSLTGDAESLGSYQSTQSPPADDFMHHIYKEPSITSGDSTSLSEPQEYSVPQPARQTDEYISPDSFPRRNELRHSADASRQSYGESDSSLSTRSSGCINNVDNNDDGYQHLDGSIESKPRSDSAEYHSGSEYVDMSPMKDGEEMDDKERDAKIKAGEYLQPMTHDGQAKSPRKLPGRPFRPAPTPPPKRPDNLPLPSIPVGSSVPEDALKSDSLDGRYERIQSLRREMGLPPRHEQYSDTDSEDDFKEKEGEEAREKYAENEVEVDGKPKSKLYHIAHEILTTERTFVNALRLVCDEFAMATKQMLEKDPSALPKYTVSQMFDDIELIYDLDKKFLQELEDRMRDWDSHNRIGDIVRKYGYFLKMYTNYIKGYDKAMAVFQECCHKMPKFAALAREYERMPSFQNLKVTSYMLKPIQRIPSYRLLLIDYLKHLPNDSKDYEDVSNGLNIVSQVAKHINESMKEGDKFQTMLKLQTRIINSKEIVKPGRYLLKEGILNKLSRKEAQERMFFLLTDCLLYCEHAAVSNQYKLREELPLSRMTLDVPENIDFNKEFTIITTKRSFTVVASSNEERDEWATAIQNAIDDVSRKIGTFTIKLDHNEKSPPLGSPTKDIGRIAPNWVPDARATMCCICCRRFTAYNRRHHCRACGEIVCKDCSSYEAPLPYLEFEAARVCEICYAHLYETLIDEEDPSEKPVMKDTSKLKRSKSAISSKFRVIKKTKRDRATRKTLPTTLTEVSAQEQKCNISGYLMMMKKKKQRKRWFVLKEHALYSYKAPSDPAAHSTLAVLGYQVNVTGNFDAGEYIFQLEHSGLKEPYVYKAESKASAEMWVNALMKASSLQSS